MQGFYVVLLAIAAVGVTADPSPALRLLEKGTHLSRNKKHVVSDDSVSDGEDEASEFGPEGCIKTWQGDKGTCMIKTACKDYNITDYQIKLICVDVGGERVRHVFNKGSFAEEETFDTLIECEACLNQDESFNVTNATAVTDMVARENVDYSNATLTDLVGEVMSMKADLKKAEESVVKLNDKVFPKAKTDKVLVHTATEHNTISNADASNAASVSASIAQAARVAMTGAVSVVPVEHSTPAKRALRANPQEEPKVEPVVSMADAVAHSAHRARHQVARHSEAPRAVPVAQPEPVVTQAQTEDDSSTSDDSEQEQAVADSSSSSEASSAETTSDSSTQETAQASEGEQVQTDDAGSSAAEEDDSQEETSDADTDGQEQQDEQEQTDADEEDSSNSGAEEEDQSQSAEDDEAKTEGEVEGPEASDAEAEEEPSDDEST